MSDSIAEGDLSRRLAAYIRTCEDAICGEWCNDSWPDCDDERHDEGRALLAALAAPRALSSHGTCIYTPTILNEPAWVCGDQCPREGHLPSCAERFEDYLRETLAEALHQRLWSEDPTNVLPPLRSDAPPP